MEKAVVGATKPKCMYPKQKYLDTLLFGATSSMHNIMLIMNALQPRMSSNTWTISFKSLLVVHLLSRSEAGNDVLSFCASQRGILSAAYKGGANSGHSGTIRTYAAYLIEKVHVYGELQRDPVRTGVQGKDGYLRNLPLSKGLLHHVACLQKQIGALLACKFYVDELSNEVTIGAFALLVQDLLRLFQAMNEGVINILQHYFEMTKDQARLGLQIYKTFAEQTTKSMDYFSVAKRMESIIHITIPQLKHAPLSLVRTLEEYLASPDFEEGQKSASKPVEPSSNKSTSKPSVTKSPAAPVNNSKSTDDDDPWSPKKTKEESKRVSTKKDMIDFFSSIDNEETTIQQNPNTFQAQMMTGGNDFQQFQLQLQQQNQLFEMQMQMQAQQNMMLQSQLTGMPGSQSFQPEMLAAQPTGLNTNPFSMGQQSSLYQNNIGNNGGNMMDMMGGGGMNNGGMNSIAPQSTGNPFRLGPSAMGSLSAPSVPMMTGPTHFNTMPNLSSQATGANPFAPSSNPLNPFSPNFGKVPTQPTDMMGMNNNSMNNGLNNNFGSNNNPSMMNSQPTGNPWGQQQQQQQQQSPFGHQGNPSSFM
ncbi:ANTH domain-containing protein [Dissophora ornata]|nr:ANTH domain-containing protein [Dissophora ornata]